MVYHSSSDEGLNQNNKKLFVTIMRFAIGAPNFVGSRLQSWVVIIVDVVVDCVVNVVVIWCVVVI